MIDPRSALARRLAGASLVSVALHCMVIANFSPVSARFAGTSALRARIVSLGGLPSEPTSPSLALEGGRGAAQAKSAQAPTSAKSYLGGSDSRRGNIPDGRDALVDLDMAVIRDYYTSRQVDQVATPLEPIPFADPPVTPASGRSARVVLLLLINERGIVDSVAILEARPPGVFDAHARAAFASVPYTPAFKDGKPVKSQKIVEILYGS